MIRVFIHMLHDLIWKYSIVSQFNNLHYTIYCYVYRHAFRTFIYSGIFLNTNPSMTAEMTWMLFCWNILPIVIAGARYASEIYRPSNVTITDCLVQLISDISHVQCGMRAWHEGIIALIYDDSTRDCHLCLPPHRAGNQARRSLPEVFTVVVRGRTVPSILYGSGHGTAAVFLPGFAINW